MIQCKVNGVERAFDDRIEYFLEVLGHARQIDFTAEGTTNANYGKSLDQYPVDTGRLRRVVEVAAERSGWAHTKPGQGRALGFAAHRSFLSYVARARHRSECASSARQPYPYP
jgi:isoquinoline 1-oxidoreductase beta subunit